MKYCSYVDIKGGLDGCGEEKTFLLAPGFLTRTVQSVTSCYIEYDFPVSVLRYKVHCFLLKVHSVKYEVILTVHRR
jgi:hypothetical protein